MQEQCSTQAPCSSIPPHERPAVLNANELRSELQRTMT